MSEILPTYYVRHPDGTYSVASPQPTAAQIALQDGRYAQCDRTHRGSCCVDPECHLTADTIERSTGNDPLTTATPEQKEKGE